MSKAQNAFHDALFFRNAQKTQELLDTGTVKIDLQARRLAMRSPEIRTILANHAMKTEPKPVTVFPKA